MKKELINFILQNIFYLLSTCFFAFLIFLIIKKKINQKLISYILNETCQIFSLFIFGYIVSLFKYTIKFTNNFAPTIICLLVISLLITYLLIELFIYSKTKKEVFVHILTLFIYAIKAELVFICLLRKITFLKFISIYELTIFLTIIKDLINHISNKTEDEVSLKNDSPIDCKKNLFKTRKKQLDIVKKELLDNYDENNSIVISGLWGSGKTSFVNALKKQLSIEGNEIVNIQCGVECDLNQMLRNMSNQIEEIMKKNKIYTKNNGVIHKYFKTISLMVENTDYKFISNLLNIIEKNDTDFATAKMKMNAELKKLENKKIFIFIDDLDRIIDEKSKINILKIIYESINLEKCLTIFTMNFGQLNSFDKNDDFFDKYIDYSINLSNVLFEEIVDEYSSIFFSSDLINTLNINTTRDEIINTIKKTNSNILYSLEYNLDDNEKSEVRNSINKFQYYSNNPRKIKKLLKTMENLLNTVNKTLFITNTYFEGKYSSVNWIEILFRIALLKVFFNDSFNSLYLLNNIKDYKKIIKYNNLYNCILHDIDEYEIQDLYQLIIYEIYNKDFSIEEKYHQQILRELESNSLKLYNYYSYIYECLNVVNNVDYAKKVLLAIEREEKYTMYLKSKSNHYLKYFVEHYSNRCIFYNFIYYPYGKQITLLLKNTIINLNEIGCHVDVESINKCANEIYKQYFKRTIDKLNQIVIFLNQEKITSKNFNFYCISDILDAQDEILNKTETIIYLKNYFNSAKITINNTDDKKLIVKDDFLDTIHLIDNMLDILKTWRDIIDYLDEKKIYFEIPNYDNFLSIKKYMDKLKNSFCLGNIENNINNIFNFIKLVENLNIEKMSNNQKNIIKEDLLKIILSLEQQKICNHIEKKFWLQFKYNVHCKFFSKNQLEF